MSIHIEPAARRALHGVHAVRHGASHAGVSPTYLMHGYAHVCTHVCTHVGTHLGTHLGTHAYTNVCTHVCTHVLYTCLFPHLARA